MITNFAQTNSPKMKRFYISMIATFFAITVYAQQTKTLTWDGVERQYLEYVPTSYNDAAPAPVMFFLHGLGDDMNNAFSTCDITGLAEEKGWILIYPQALDYAVEIPMVGQQDFGNTWAAGVTVNVTIEIYGFPMTFTFTLNENVDDSGFLNALITTVESEYTVDTDSIFFTGFSVGGFMCHRMAIEHGDRINGIAAVSGLVGNDMASLTPSGNVNVLEVFGTSDPVINYEDASIQFQGYGPFEVGLNAEQSTAFWRDFNQCDTDEVFEQYPDTQNDGLTFEMHSYLNGNNDTRVSFLKVNNGVHNWYSGDNYDIDYVTEIYRFFTNTMDVTNVEENAVIMTVYPNPAQDEVTIPLDKAAEVIVYNINGMEVMRCLSNGSLDVSELPSGLYLIRTENTSQSTKLTISR